MEGLPVLNWLANVRYRWRRRGLDRERALLRMERDILLERYLALPPEQRRRMEAELREDYRREFGREMPEDFLKRRPPGGLPGRSA